MPVLCYVVQIILKYDFPQYLQARADEKGRELGDLVNELLKREIDLVEAVK